MKSLSRLFSLTLPIVMVVMAVGCGEDDGLGSSAKVEGTVKMNGEPLKDGSITFYPDASKGNDTKYEPVGHITDGQFIMTTNGKDMVPLGWYKVAIRSEVRVNPKDEYSVMKSIINQKFAKPDESGLTAEVVDSDGKYLFEVSK